MKSIVNILNIFLIILTLSISNSFSSDRVESTITKAQSLIMNEMRDETYFNMPSFLGTPYTVQYMLYTMYSNKEELFPAKWQSFLEEKILLERNHDGSWRYLRDENNSQGELGATILNYWALKVFGHNKNSVEMLKSKQFILDNGGLESAPVFLQIFLAIFNNYPYKKLPFPPIPNLLFSKSKLVPSSIKASTFGQWVAPHLLPIIYLTRYEVRKELEPRFRLDELYSKKIPSRIIKKIRITKRKIKHRTEKKIYKYQIAKTSQFLINKLMASQKKAGSYGGYTLATLLTNMSYEHYLTIKPHSKNKEEMIRKINKGDQYLTKQHFDEDKQEYIFGGWTCDGRIWDTALLTQALIESDIDPEEIKNAVDYVVSFQAPQGGFPFGLDFETYPDHDDAAEVLLLLNLASKKFPNIYNDVINKLVKWLLSRQNKDGGWGAFDVDNNGNKLVSFLAGNLLDSVDLFDESSPDVTAHVMEALASNGLNINNSSHLKRGLQYLKETRDEKGLWLGRWGINYIYATSAVIVALNNSGVSIDEEILKTPSKWLLDIQNSDGGYGESAMSYQNPKLAGVGLSTVTQTAWALNALLKLPINNKRAKAAIKKSSNYLVHFMETHKRWYDTSVVGTGHPGIVYMDYPSYAFAFPLIALSNYKHSRHYNDSKERRLNKTTR